MLQCEIWSLSYPAVRQIAKLVDTLYHAGLIILRSIFISSVSIGYSCAGICNENKVRQCEDVYGLNYERQVVMLKSIRYQVVCFEHVDMRSVLFCIQRGGWLCCLPVLGISRFVHIFTVHTILEIEGVIRVTNKGGGVVLSMNVENQPLPM